MKRLVMFALCAFGALGARKPWDGKDVPNEIKHKSIYEKETIDLRYGGWGAVGPCYGRMTLSRDGFGKGFEVSPFGVCLTMVSVRKEYDDKSGYYYGFGGSAGVFATFVVGYPVVLPRLGPSVMLGYQSEKGFIEVGLYDDIFFRAASISMYNYPGSFLPPMPILKIGYNL